MKRLGLLLVFSFLLLGCAQPAQQTTSIETKQPQITLVPPPTTAPTTPPTPVVTTIMTREGYPTQVPLSALAISSPTPTQEPFCEPNTKKCVEKPYEDYTPTKDSPLFFTCVCDSTGRAYISTETCNYGCKDGKCLSEPAAIAPPKESVPTPSPFPANECQAGKTTEVDTPVGKSRTEILGIEEIVVFSRPCSVCHLKSQYIGSGRLVERWFSRNFDSGEQGACQKMSLTITNPDNAAELKIETIEIWINGLRQTCAKENGVMKSGPEIKCD